MNDTTGKPSAKRALKFLRVVVFLLLAAAILLGAINYLLTGFIDFPCFVKYDAAGQCMDKGSQMGMLEPVDETTRIEAFMTTFVAGWSGGGCDYQHSKSDSLDLRSSTGAIELSRQGDALLVNGKPLEAGETYRRTHWLDWHPWIIAKTQFTNAGVAPDCQGDPAVERLVVIGSYGTQTSPLKGWLVMLALAAALVYIQLQIRKK